jgi:flavin-dependent dehydrogenase
MAPSVLDVIVVGGGIAGSTLGGVPARSDLGVLVLQKGERFRDRVRAKAGSSGTLARSTCVRRDE